MTSQICKNSGCEQTNPQPINNFRIYKKKYRVSECGECEKKRARENRKKKYATKQGKQTINEQNSGWRKLNEYNELYRAQQNEKYATDPEFKELRKAQSKEWRRKNPDQKREISAAWYQKNKKDIQAKWNKRNADDPAFKLRNNLRKAINEALRFNGGDKNGRSILQYLPYTMEKLKSHLEAQWEPWMDWSNYGPLRIGDRTWQIDHITPQISLPYSDFSDINFSKCWTLSNLRPLESGANISKGARILAS